MDGSFEAPRLLEEFHAYYDSSFKAAVSGIRALQKGEYLLNPFRIGQLDEINSRAVQKSVEVLSNRSWLISPHGFFSGRMALSAKPGNFVAILSEAQFSNVLRRALQFTELAIVAIMVERLN